MLIFPPVRFLMTDRGNETPPSEDGVYVDRSLNIYVNRNGDVYIPRHVFYRTRSGDGYVSRADAEYVERF